MTTSTQYIAMRWGHELARADSLRLLVELLETNELERDGLVIERWSDARRLRVF